MDLKNRRGAPREGAPLNIAILAGCEVQNSDISLIVQIPRAIQWLARRTGLTVSTAAAVASANRFGNVR